MKTIISFIAATLISLQLIAQTPGCNYLTVENIQMDNDTANLMKITIKNTCTNCTSGLNGCVYMELQVIKTVSQFDTIASSHCWCKWTPDNNSQRTYSVTSTVTSVPPLNTIRVSLLANTCGCDTIPYSTVLGLSSNEIANSIAIYPNPSKDQIFIVTTGGANSLTLKVTDALGKVLKTEKLNSDHETINIANLEKGLYIVEIIAQSSRTIKTFKVIKE